MRRAFVTFWVAVLTAGLALPASADHTNPATPQSAIAPALPGTGLLAQGEGTWDFITNFPPNPGSDLQFFEKGGSIYSSSGTLGQAQVQFVGQRILRLTNPDGTVAPTWIADHGSAKCEANTAVTGLQHDAEVTPQQDPKLLVDTTDATGRCHDTPGGGIELIDISGLPNASTVREVGLIRFRGFSHTATTDPSRPGIIYNSTSDSRTPHLWIDVVDARTCFRGTTLAEKRDLCRPDVYRLTWEHRPDWTRRDPDGEERPRPNEPESEAACHDITIVGNTLYCASLHATIIFDIGGIFTESKDGRMKLRGSPLPCPRIAGTRTGARVTNCSAFGQSTDQNRIPRLHGWEFLGNYNHPGRVPNPSVLANLNMEVPADEGISVSHESDPTPDGRYLMVTDERGGGIVPPGASCTPGIDNPYGNGGIHWFDLTQRVPDMHGGPAYFPYAPAGSGGDNETKAIWRGEPIVPAATFCDVHVIEHMPDEARIFMAYYSQGIKVLDYFVDDQGRISFRETASLTLEGDNDWTAEPFKWVDNGDGTRTYYIMASDIQRGIDFVSWTGTTNPLVNGSAPPPTSASSAISAGDAGLLGLAVLGLPAAVLFGRRRRRSV